MNIGFDFSAGHEVSAFSAAKIIEEKSMTETVEVEVDATFKDRWIEPILHPVRVPFQPWIKTKRVYREVPSRKVICTPYGYIMHPALKSEVVAALRDVVV